MELEQWKMARSKFGLLALSATVIVLCGCSTEGIGIGMNRLTGQRTADSFSGFMISHVSERRVKLPEKSLLESLKGNDQEDPEQRTLRLSRQEIASAERLPNSEPLVSYTKRVLAKLIAVSPEPNRKVDVIITTSTGYSAAAMASGEIIVPQGVFVNAESEDEFAYVLAHELSHLLLNHFASEEHARQRKEHVDLAAGLLFAATGKKDQHGGKTGRTDVSLAYLAVDRAQKYILNPGWRRQQEEEADLLGQDLLIKAQYSNAAAPDMFKRMVASAKLEEQERLAAEKASADQIDTLMRQGRISEGMNQAFEKLGQAPTVIIDKLSEALLSAHPDPQQREVNVASYLARQYGDEMPPDLDRESFRKNVFEGPARRALSNSTVSQLAQRWTQDGKLEEAEALLLQSIGSPKDYNFQVRLALYEVRLKMAKPEIAIKDLELARQDPEAPAKVFDLLIGDYESRGDPRKALAALDAKENRFHGGAAVNYPLRLRLLYMAKDSSGAKQIMDRCLATKDAKLIDSCSAVKGSWDEASLTGPGGRFL
jgi:predicted Zn-dependent protease